jgi:hypothetical protein
VSTLSIVQPSTSPTTVQNREQSIAVILLDAENIRLCVEEEKFLETCGQHALQIKIAFANWRAISKQQDSELNDRGYQMIHVPAGKNSADMKMTAIGSSLFLAYPHIKEVFVCSSDADLAHLCNTLRLNGLTAYAVRRGSTSLHVINTATRQAFSYPPAPPILSLEKSLEGIKAIIQAQQKLTSNQWVQLSWLSKKFQETYGFTLSQLVNHHTPGKRARDLFIDRPGEYVIHQVTENSAIHISLFMAVEQSNLISIAPSSATEEKLTHTSKSQISSRIALEKALLSTFATLVPESQHGAVKVAELCAQFSCQHGLQIKQVLQTLEVEQERPVDFLKTCSKFKLELDQGHWYIKRSKS